ncbi:hypothetical protein [Mesorhizobium sp. M1322]|uniref:hypothetical protein n=1 Tax=Mesorhizobium sp. M1322 TaxID=2957081 RepID=UPI0033386B1A
MRQSGLGAAHHGRISKVGRHARAMLVGAARAAAKTPGPLNAFLVRIRARRGHQAAVVAVARKLGTAQSCRPQDARHGVAGRRRRKGTVAAPPTPTM